MLLKSLVSAEKSFNSSRDRIDILRALRHVIVPNCELYHLTKDSKYDKEFRQSLTIISNYHKSRKLLWDNNVEPNTFFRSSSNVKYEEGYLETEGALEYFIKVDGEKQYLKVDLKLADEYV